MGGATKGGGNRLQNEWAGLPPAAEPFGELAALADRNEQLEDTIRSLTREVRRLEMLAYLDPLTGLGNRRHFDALLSSELGRAARTGEPLTLLICDVDRFKQCNDAYGHDTGDTLLVDIGNLLRRYCRRGGDLAVRYAGDEFALLWPGVGRHAGWRLADELRKAAHGLPIRHPRAAAAAPITMSVGGSTFEGRGRCLPARLVNSADRAMYRAKRTGRDRTVFADREPAGDGARE